VAAGPLVGGAVTQGLDWHWIFWVNVPIGVVALLLSLRLLRESKGPQTRLDPVGALLITAAATALAWGLRASDAGWGSVETVGTLGGGAVLLACFVLWERQAAAPMLPLALFRIRAFTAANATGFLMFGSIFSAAFLTSQYFQFGLGYSPLSTGLRFLPWTAAPVVVAPLAGALSDRIGRRPLLATGLPLQAFALAWIASHAAVGVDYGALILPLVIAGIGISMAIPTTTTAAISAVGPRPVPPCDCPVDATSSVGRSGLAPSSRPTESEASKAQAAHLIDQLISMVYVDPAHTDHRVLRRLTGVFNPVVLRFAPHVPLYVVLEHHGRRSGRVFRTPLAGIRVDSGFLSPSPSERRHSGCSMFATPPAASSNGGADAWSSPIPKSSVGTRASPRSLGCSGGLPRSSA
jgi:MFS family permease